MNRLLKAQLKKAFGKEFDLNTQDEKLQKFIELVEESYEDFSTEIKMLDNVLEVNAKELTASNREIVENHELIKSVTNSVSDIIFYKDINFKYIGCNQNFESLVGKKEEEIIGKDDFYLFSEESANLFRKKDKQVVEDNIELTNKEWVKFPNGEDAYFSTYKTPLLDISGNKIGIVGVARDITKEYELEKEVQHKQALLIHQSRLASMGDMIGNIAHQWRQPLNALGLIVQKIGYFAKEETRKLEKLDENVEKGMSIIYAMSETIDDFRDFFNPNKEKGDFLVKEAINKAYHTVEPVLKNMNIECNINIGEDYLIHGFKNEFSQVILNLLNNSKDALIENKIENPSIFIDVIKEANNIIINVLDNGGGIPEDQIDKIYDPYFSTKEEGKGTGIGLYMSKMIIEDHMDGQMSALNTLSGMKFTISVGLVTS